MSYCGGILLMAVNGNMQGAIFPVGCISKSLYENTTLFYIVTNGKIGELITRQEAINRFFDYVEFCQPITKIIQLKTNSLGTVKYPLNVYSLDGTMAGTALNNLGVVNVFNSYKPNNYYGILRFVGGKFTITNTYPNDFILVNEQNNFNSQGIGFNLLTQWAN